MKGLQGKTAIVTGGSSGIGQAIAIRLGQEGVNVAVNYVGPLEGATATRDTIESSVRECVDAVNSCPAPSRAVVVEADVSDEDSVARMFKQVRGEFGHVDFLVNNAGIQIAAESDMLDAAAFDRVLAVNLRGAFLCAREQIRTLLETETAGSIVNISSVHQLIPKPQFLGYSVSKGGMQNLTRTLALEYAGRGIRVNAIGPGATVTPINRAWVDDPDKREMVTAHIPMGRPGEAEEMGAVAAFLLSDEAAYITGQTLFVDGGLTLFADFPRHVVVRVTALEIPAGPAPGAADATADVFWPSKYGADDEAGALNEIGPANVLRAVGLVRTGRVFDLAHVLDDRVPAFPGRAFRQLLTQVPTRRVGTNDVNWIVEWVNAPSQMGTHMDGLNHLHLGDRMYNGHRLADVAAEHGTTKLGMEKMPQVVTRGVLVDVAAVRGVARLEPGDVITPDDVAAAGVSVRPGDAVLLHTGHGALWDADGERYTAGEPGPGRALAEWLVDRRVALTGCDTWSYGPVPPEEPDAPFAVPQWLNTHHGLTVLENLRLADLAAAGIDEFLFVVSHAKFRGATGAWVAPLAIV